VEGFGLLCNRAAEDAWSGGATRLSERRAAQPPAVPPVAC